MYPVVGLVRPVWSIMVHHSWTVHVARMTLTWLKFPYPVTIVICGVLKPISCVFSILSGIYIGFIYSTGSTCPFISPVTYVVVLIYSLVADFVVYILIK